tara:strand:- start:105 stop:587 length:483 start_codon:yes stop_codon:yes gene_type:complete
MARRRRRAAALASDFGTPERRQHDPVVIERVEAESAEVRARARVYTRSPLETLRKRNAISERAKAAGEKLREIWERANLEPRVIGSYAELVAHGSVASLTVGDIKHDAHTDFVRAVRAVGPIASNEVLACCCLDEYVGGNMVEILSRGLEVLADFFGIPA